LTSQFTVHLEQSKVHISNVVNITEILERYNIEMQAVVNFQSCLTGSTYWPVSIMFAIILP